MLQKGGDKLIKDFLSLLPKPWKESLSVETFRTRFWENVLFIIEQFSVGSFIRKTVLSSHCEVIIGHWASLLYSKTNPVVGLMMYHGQAREY